MYFLKTLKDEIKSTLKNRDIIILLVGAPILLTLIFGGVYSNSYVEDIPIAVLDEDNSSMSRMIIQQFDENERFYIQDYAGTREELKRLIEQRKVHMGLYIPIDFYKDVSSGNSKEILIIVDGTNMIIGNNAYAAAAGIIQTIAAGTQMKIISAKGMMPQVAENMALAFQFNDRTLYDPRMTYMNYLLLGFVAVFLQQIILSGLGISVLQDKEHLAQKHTILGILSKIIACGSIALLSTSAAVAIAAFVFKVTIRGSVGFSLLMCALFILAMSGPAIILATFADSKVKLGQIAFMLSLPTFVSCGYVWPIDQMPKILVNVIKSLWPLIYFARPFDEVLLKGLSVNAIKEPLIQMGIYTVFWLPIAIWILKRKHSALNANIEPSGISS
ncbi:ABC-2 type transport system permease protein [Anaerosolibacter carboniphilus]|uniref:ABC-2 type transport system permease protein n=1 Tax=Anaerosolibacter carboniphilus TaxID=1417629 RepID=A0A841KXV0_9FIRM|nr:ABC transporter permease [Anaerosolibacter carboniphilus]MBB6217108.1 ABC-2 type transport system permease protein [Anaerosolibacter carboniphilus]